MSKIDNVDDILRAMRSGSFLWKTEDGWVLGFGIRSFGSFGQPVTNHIANAVIRRPEVSQRDVYRGPIYVAA